MKVCNNDSFTKGQCTSKNINKLLFTNITVRNGLSNCKSKSHISNVKQQLDAIEKTLIEIIKIKVI